jgi:Uma2 family endonuclease
MSASVKSVLHHMTVAEFLDWDPGNVPGRWQLRNGEPELMAPASVTHGSIQARVAYLVTAHLDARGGSCRVVITPGVVPAHRADDTCLVPDLGITCAPPTGAHLLAQPLVLVEVLSPSNVSRTRANVRAYRSIPGLAEIVVLHTTVVAAEILRRGPDGVWPREPEVIGAEETLRLDSIGFAGPLRDVYRTSGLV